MPNRDDYENCYLAKYGPAWIVVLICWVVSGAVLALIG